MRERERRGNIQDELQKLQEEQSSEKGKKERGRGI